MLQMSPCKYVYYIFFLDIVVPFSSLALNEIDRVRKIFLVCVGLPPWDSFSVLRKSNWCQKYCQHSKQLEIFSWCLLRLRYWQYS